MKIKLISLLIALLCVSVLFVSCSEECTTHLDADGDGICDTEGCEDTVQLPEEPEEPECTNHVDANNDKLCDTEGCGTVILTNVVEDRVEVLVPIEKDEKIPMVIKPIPTDAVATDYINVDFENGVLTLYIHGYKPIEEAKIVEDLGEHYYIIKTSKHVSDPVPASGNNEAKEATRADTYTIINDVTGYTCELITTKPYEYINDNPQTPSIDETWDDAPSFDFTTGYYVDTVRVGSDYYLFTKEQHTVINEEALDSWEVVEARDSARVINGICYITIKDTKYAIKDNVVIHSDDVMFMLHRPAFDVETEAFGIIEDDDAYTLYFYDLTKWIECTYSYTVNADMYEWFVLANGNVFVQTVNMLPDSSVNYDFIVDGVKADVDYFIVNPATKTVTETEFGYVVTNVYAVNGEKTPNVFYVYSGNENGETDLSGDGISLVVDNELNIVAELNEDVLFGEVEHVADGLFVKDLYINGSWYEVVTDVNGKMLNYLPYSYYAFDDCIVLDNGDIYTYTLQLKLKLSDYDRYEMWEDYIILWDTVKVTVGEEETTKEVVYYWNTTLEAPVLISDNTEAKDVYTTNSDYFVVEVAIYSTDEEPVITGYKYQIYGYANALLIDNVISWNYYTETIDGEVYKFLWVDVTIEGGHSVSRYILNDVAPAPATDPAPAA